MDRRRRILWSLGSGLGLGVAGLALWLAAASCGGPEADLLVARLQMAFSLAWHIVLACLGVGMPILLLVAEAQANRRQDPVAKALVQRWAKAFAVLFAVGAVSGTILSFELGMLWPGLMERFGQVIGLPFAFEGIAFFIEAIFLGIYLYGFDRLSPRAHWWTGVPIAISGLASAFFVMTANAWMNQPEGFRIVDGALVDVDPWAAMFNAATPVEATHMILGAIVVAGSLVAARAAHALLHRRGDAAIHRKALAIAFGAAAMVIPFQIAAGDWAARFVAKNQPVKLAAFEGIFKTTRGAPLHIGGIPIDGEMRYAIEIPGGLSWLAHGSPDAVVAGLEEVPASDRPPVLITHLAFQLMVGGGFYLLGVASWYALLKLRRRDPVDSRWHLRAILVAGPVSVLALEAGWVATEVGRQPWIVQGVLRVADAVSAAPGLRYGALALIVVYAALTAATIYVLLLLAGQPEKEARR